MKAVELRPIRVIPDEYDRIEQHIKSLFREQFYVPLILEIGPRKNILKNTLEDLRTAILEGKIRFYRGKFTGQFNSILAKELKAMGAKWDKKTSSWQISLNEMHPEIKSAVNVSAAKFEQTAKKIDKKLSEVVPEEITSKLKIDHLFDKAMYKVDQEFNQSIKNITVAPQMTPDRRARLAKEYSENMKLKIRGWLQDEILELRKKIQENTFEGHRYEQLVQTIQDSYGVSQRKSKFLARQETNLLLSKFKQIRYEDAGVKQYKWKCVSGSAQHPVRPRHKQLNDESAKGKLFRFDDPPITTEPGEPLRKNNPGEDFNCRCTAIPVVSFISE